MLSCAVGWTILNGGAGDAAAERVTVHKKKSKAAKWESRNPIAVSTQASGPEKECRRSKAYKSRHMQVKLHD